MMLGMLVDQMVEKLDSSMAVLLVVTMVLMKVVNLALI